VAVSKNSVASLPLWIKQSLLPFRQVIQYSYFLQNSRSDLKDYDIAKMIATDVIEIWQAVNPQLPLYKEYYIVKLIDKVCFKKSKG
jgi:hypothetical protein